MITSIIVNGTRFTLTRVTDGVGDSGGMLDSINPVTIEKEGPTGLIKVGNSVMCGSLHTRTFGQDWWATTPVTEILEVSDDQRYVKFKTNNSIYEVQGE